MKGYFDDKSKKLQLLDDNQTLLEYTFSTRTYSALSTVVLYNVHILPPLHIT